LLPPTSRLKKARDNQGRYSAEDSSVPGIKAMMGRRFRMGAAIWATLGCAFVSVQVLHAQQVVSSASTPMSPLRADVYRPVLPAPSSATQHPLAWVLKYIRDEQAYLQQNVRDFTCRLTKRERIEGRLQDYYYINMHVREEASVGTRAVRPLSVLLEFLSPSEIAGRKILFVAGQNDNKMLVRKGGKRFSFLVIDLDPFGPSAQQESLIPITELGFQQQLGRTIRVLERDMAVDQSGENTKVEHIKGASINDRSCEVIRITHPKQHNGLQFFQANMYVDSQLHLPVRIDAYGWPEQTGQEPPLLAEYTYTNLKLNVDLSDSLFEPAILRSH
jgi:hypothetical protein